MVRRQTKQSGWFEVSEGRNRTPDASSGSQY